MLLRNKENTQYVLLLLISMTKPYVQRGVTVPKFCSFVSTVKGEQKSTRAYPRAQLAEQTLGAFAKQKKEHRAQEVHHGLPPQKERVPA